MQLLARVARRRFAANADWRTRRNTTVECSGRSYFCGFVSPRDIGPAEPADVRRARPSACLCGLCGLCVRAL